MSTGWLTPDEEKALQEQLNFDPERIDDFLREFFPKQYKLKAESEQRGKALAGEGIEYTILQEGVDFVTFEFEGRQIRLDREPFEKVGRPRANPWIDTRQVNQMGRATKMACYAVAAYKLRKEGAEGVSFTETTVGQQIRKALFRGDHGLVCLQHLLAVCDESFTLIRAVPLPEGVTREALVMRILLGAISNTLSQEWSEKP